MVGTLRELLAEQEAQLTASSLLERAMAWEELLSGFPARFQKACQASVRAGDFEVAGWERLLSQFYLLDDDRDPLALPRRQALQAMVRLHLQALRWIQDRGQWTTPEIPPDALSRMVPPEQAREIGVPLPFLLDLIHFLVAGEVRRADRQVELPVLLVDRRGPEGRVARLRLESVPDGETALFPHPHMAFLYEDEAFREARRRAWAWAQEALGWPKGVSARWSLAFPEFAPRILEGPSMGAAFAAGLWALVQMGK